MSIRKKLSVLECLCRIAYSKGIEKFYYNKDEEKDTELLSLTPWIMTLFFTL